MAERGRQDYLVWVDINLRALRANYAAIKNLAQRRYAQAAASGRTKTETPVLAVIKSDAYGHGMLKVAAELDKLGVNFFAVSDVPEGVLLRRNGIKKPILIFESTLPALAKSIIDYQLIPTVCTRTFASSLNTLARRFNKKVGIHLYVDTGMSRLGIPYAEAEIFVKDLLRYKNLNIKGLYTHFPVADTNADLTFRQIEQLDSLLKAFSRFGVFPVHVHAANSMGLVGYKTSVLNLARPGLMLYGLYPSAKAKKDIKLEPVMSIKAQIIFIRRIPKGTGISYGHTFVAARESVIATLPIGYNDGYFRCLSNKSSVLVNGTRCPVVGRVTMDQTMIDVTGVKGVDIGTTVVMLGQQGKKSITADDLACQANTINYEIVCSLGNRLPRVYHA